MNTAKATAYQRSFTGWFTPVKSRKSPQNRAFSWNRSTYSGKAHCIKDSVLLDETCRFHIIIMTQANSQVNTRVLELLPKFKTQKMNRWYAV